MANRQVYPPTLSPLQGDIASTPGSPNVTVTGIQTIPFDPATPLTGQIPVMGGDGKWHPEDPVVSGTDPVGTTPSKPPVQVGGIDEGLLVREFKTDTSGSLRAYTIEDKLDIIIGELRALKLAVISLDNTAVAEDFIADQFSNDPA